MDNQSDKASDQELVNVVCAEFFQVVYGSLRLEMSAAQKGHLYEKAKAEALRTVRTVRRDEKRTQPFA